MTHKSTRMACTLDWLGRSVICLLATALGLYLWAAYLEPPWLEYRALPWEVIKPVKPGEVIRVVVLRCNHTGSKRVYTVTRSLINIDTGDTFVLPSSEVDIEPGCHREISKVSFVPKSAPPGTYILNGFGLAPGRLVTHRVPWHTQRFEVTE